MITKKLGGYDLFKVRTLIVATMHKKAEVIVPILKSSSVVKQFQI